MLVLAVACSAGDAPLARSGSGGSPSSSGSPLRAVGVVPLPASSTALRLPARCGPSAVGLRAAELLAAVNSGDGQSAARQFKPGEALWEAYGHADPPNGTAGGLRSDQDIAAFVAEIRRRGEVWTDGSLLTPVGDANLPDSTGYGLRFTVTLGGQQRADGGKVAVDCATGFLTHVVGPSAGRSP